MFQNTNEHFPQHFIMKKFPKYNKIEKFLQWACAYPPPTFHNWLFMLFFTYLFTCLPLYPSPHLIFWCISKKVTDISKFIPKYFNMLYNIFMYFLHQYLNCDLQWRIVYVFKIIVQRQGLEIRPLQRNRNASTESWL